MKRPLICLTPLLLMLSACSGRGENATTHESDTSSTLATASTEIKELKQIGQQRSGAYVVTLFNESGVVKQGPNRFTLEVRDASTNALVAVEKIHIESSMDMPGQPSMTGSGSAVPGDVPGRYVIGSDFAARSAVGDDVSSPRAGRMPGQWKLVVTFHPNQRIEFAAYVAFE